MNINSPEISRNLGFIAPEIQERIMGATIAIAGAGGDGGLLAEQLARLGVGTLKLADPDPFEVENLNRQAFCNQATIGTNKAEAVANGVLAINPDIKVVRYTEGVTPENIEDFVHGSDLVLDETEFTMHSLGVMIAREARRQNVPNLMVLNVGFGASHTSFLPDGLTFEDMLGLSSQMPLDEIEEQPVGLERWLADLPPYLDLNMLDKVMNGEMSAPTVAPGVAIAAGTAASQVVLHLSEGKIEQWPRPIVYDDVLTIDGMTGISKIHKHPNPAVSKALYDRC